MTFRNQYIPDKPMGADGSNDWQTPAAFETGAKDLAGFVRDFGGASFNNSLYRVHRAQDISGWTQIVEDAFPEFKGRTLCFSYDWLGRHFAVDRARQDRGQFLILMFEPGTGQALEIPATFLAFHDTELVDYPNDSLAVEFYESWLASGGTPPDPTQCVGYKKPLFLGGSDEAGNLELSDMDVYWSVCGQILNRIRNLPDGTRIGRVDIGK